MSQVQILQIMLMIGISLNHFLVLWAITKAAKTGDNTKPLIIVHTYLLPMFLIIWSAIDLGIAVSM